MSRRNKEKLSTMKELAEALGISRTTVSLCLSGKSPDYKISEATRRRVIEYARQAGYVPNLMAQSINRVRGEKTGLLASLKYPSGLNHEVFVYATQVLERENSDYVLQHYNTEKEIFNRIYNMMGLKVKNIFIIGLEGEDEVRLVKELKPFLRDIRVFIINYHFHGGERKQKNFYRIGINREKTYLSIFEYLYKKGHRNIAIDDPRQKVAAYRRFNEKYSIALNDELIIKVDRTMSDSFESGYIMVPRIIELYEKYGVSALSLHDDQVAAAIVSGLLENGIDVPGDISVIGFDNINAAPYFKIPLTSYEHPIRRMADYALDAILKGIDIPYNVLTEGKIVERSSVRDISS